LPLISISFLFLFLPASLVFHFFAARSGERVRLCALVAISFAFLALWDIRAAAVLAGSIAVNFGIGRLLEQAREDGREFQAGVFLATGILFNLGVLAAFRYSEFLAAAVDSIANAGFDAGKILMPLGVLVVSCDQIAYLVDLHRGKNIKTDILRYAAFVTFFPRLIAGPLLRYGQIERQWNSDAPDAEDFAVGLTTFAVGLAKVILLANLVAPFAASVFSAAGSGEPIGLFAGWTGLLAFTCQIYFDLSGYADMAIGLGRCFGLKLPTNFRSPYRATNIAEFWRSWNVTLFDFLRDYVYRPLRSDSNTLRGGLSVVMATVLAGLWYGAGHMLVAWALLHAGLLLSHRAWRSASQRFDRLSSFAARGFLRVLSVALTFLVVTLSWVLFRSADAATAINMFAALSGWNGALLPLDYASSLGRFAAFLQAVGIGFAPGDGKLLLQAWASILLCLLVIFALPNTESLLSFHRSASADNRTAMRKIFALRWSHSPLWSVAMGVLAFVCLVCLNSVNPLLHWRL
jgi:D-alanyl-lipoteichoic acid acyltransferase DltB (MBOAT superfamily)